MKFAVCTECLDWVKLGMQERSCKCGKTGGVYRQDGRNAAIWGPCFPVSVDNGKFHTATTRRNNKETLATVESRRAILRGEWFIIVPSDPDSHVEVFPSRRAAYAAPTKRFRRPSRSTVTVPSGRR